MQQPWQQSAAPKPELLRLDGIELTVSDGSAAPLFSDFSVGRGELLLIDPGDAAYEQLLADAICGLIAPSTGSLRFLGHAWDALPPAFANALRGRIGHFFRDGNWIPHAPLADNIILAERFHTKRAEVEVLDEAARLARALGLPGLPTRLPGEAAESDLQRAALVRAFLGMPALVVLESAATGFPTNLLGPVVNLIRAARDREAGVIWFMLESDLWYDPSIPADRRLRLRGQRLTEEET